MSRHDHYVTREGSLVTGELSPFEGALARAIREIKATMSRIRPTMEDAADRRVEEATKEIINTYTRRLLRLRIAQERTTDIVERMMASGHFTLDEVGQVAEVLDVVADVEEPGAWARSQVP